VVFADLLGNDVQRKGIFSGFASLLSAKGIFILSGFKRWGLDEENIALGAQR
jgi:hypothetical protein